LQDWAALTIGSVDRQVAGAFVAWMRTRHSRQWTGDRRTVRKYMSSLSGYWKWLKAKGLAVENPWLDQPLARVPPGDRTGEIRERAFTDDEIFRLINGPADIVLVDLMKFGALTGARLEANATLRIKDCIGGNFRFKANRNETRARLVPIHSELVAIVSRRAEGKRLDAFLFEEVGSRAEAAGRQRLAERSTAIGKRFGRYLRSQNMAVRVSGKRRSLINFESFRRWFIAKAANAGQPEDVIAAVVGYKRKTFAAYSAGPGLDRLRNCVEIVLLPINDRWSELRDEAVCGIHTDCP
jgi:integrase